MHAEVDASIGSRLETERKLGETSRQLEEARFQIENLSAQNSEHEGREVNLAMWLGCGIVLRMMGRFFWPETIWDVFRGMNVT